MFIWNVVDKVAWQPILSATVMNKHSYIWYTWKWEGFIFRNACQLDVSRGFALYLMIQPKTDDTTYVYIRRQYPHHISGITTRPAVLFFWLISDSELGDELLMNYSRNIKCEICFIVLLLSIPLQNIKNDLWHRKIIVATVPNHDIAHSHLKGEASSASFMKTEK